LDFSLEQNYPNPFNPSTTICFNLGRKTNLDISVYNILGEKISTIVSGEFTAGSHSVTWSAQDNNGQNLATGVYLYRMTAGEFSAVNKMILMK